jgi:hypothetical protein
MSEDERMIIHRAAVAAMEFGSSITRIARDEIEDAGYPWTEEHENYVFENYALRGAK